MLIKTLTENTSLTPAFGHEHGLSLYIEAAGHKLLFDTGETGLFLENARRLSVPIPEVDTVILSHGHSDHGGGLRPFLQQNARARIYARENAFDRHVIRILGVSKSIGVDKTLKNHPQVVLTGARTEIDENLLLFSDVKTSDFHSTANNSLLAVQNRRRVRDDFTHEQNLLIRDGERWFLISGCSHRGIVNIKRRATEILGREPDFCIGGFHLYNPTSGKRESDELVCGIAAELQKGSARYYTCHCTGPHAFETMKTVMGERLGYLSAGTVLEI